MKAAAERLSRYPIALRSTISKAEAPQLRILFGADQFRHSPARSRIMRSLEAHEEFMAAREKPLLSQGKSDLASRTF
jgi:hypothetical protein